MGREHGDSDDSYCGLYYCNMACARLHWQLEHKEHLLNYRAAKLNYRIARDLLAEATETRRELPYDLQMRHYMLGIDDDVRDAAAFAQESYITYVEARALRAQK